MLSNSLFTSTPQASLLLAIGVLLGATVLYVFLKKIPSPWPLGAFAGAFILGMPGFGLLLLLFLLVAAIVCARRPTTRQAQRVAMPTATQFAPTKTIQHVSEALFRLQNTTLDVASRSQAMLYLAQLRKPQINQLLQEHLADESEDIRLLAYSLLEKQSGSLFTVISRLRDHLSSTTDRDVMRHYHKQLAMAYWELLYWRLVYGEFAQQIRQQCCEHAELALHASARDAELYALLGRLALQADQSESALRYFIQAQQYGAQPRMVLPYLANLYYQARQWTELRSVLCTAQAVQDIPVLHKAARFWMAYE